MRKSSSFLLVGLMLGVVGSVSAKHANRPLGDSEIINAVPVPPGFPEGIAVNKDRFYVSGPASEIPGPGNARILEYDLDNGALLRSIAIHQPVPPPFPGVPYGLSQIAFDQDDRLYIADTVQGIVKLNLQTEGQTVYSPPLPNLPPCTSLPTTSPCSPTPSDPDLPPLPNDIVFDRKGNLYITDSFQATIWRIPPGGGAATIWFQDPRLASGFQAAPFGVNGMRFDKKGDTAYLAVTFGSAAEGYIYTLNVSDHPVAADLKLFHQYAPGAGPDGVAFGKSGKLYVALAGYSGISVLNPDGSEAAEYFGPAKDPEGRTAYGSVNGFVPWANPANLAFNDKEGTLLATNHASIPPSPDYFAVFDVVVNDKAQKLETPKIK